MVAGARFELWKRLAARRRRPSEALDAAHARSLMNHLVRPEQHHLRDGETERPCNFGVE